jgi:hypothetical protein
MANADLLNAAERKLLPSAVSCIAIKVSDLTIAGDVKLSDTVPAAGQYAGTPPPIPLCFDPNWAVLLLLQGTDPRRRSIHYLRGIPDTLCQGTMPARFASDNAWGASVVALGVLAQQAAQLVRKDPANPGKYLVEPIAHMRSPANNATTLMHLRRSGRPFVLRRGRRGP